MTVKELSEQLTNLPQDAKVFLWDITKNYYVKAQKAVLGNARLNDEVKLDDGSSEALYERAVLIKHDGNGF